MNGEIIDQVVKEERNRHTAGASLPITCGWTPIGSPSGRQGIWRDDLYRLKATVSQATHDLKAYVSA